MFHISNMRTSHVSTMNPGNPTGHRRTAGNSSSFSSTCHIPGPKVAGVNVHVDVGLDIAIAIALRPRLLLLLVHLERVDGPVRLLEGPRVVGDEILACAC